MSSNYFSEDDEPFQDIPEEVNGQNAEVPQVKVNRPAAQQQPVQQRVEVQAPVYEDQDVVVSEEDEDFSEVLTDARFRLEQGRLYEMIMNHNIFEGADADEKAIKYVTKQIRNFAKEQMEIMLGMRQEKSEVQPLAAADFPFNDLEVQTLKALASAATKGATAAPEAQSFSGAQQPSAKRVGLNAIGVKPSQSARPAPKPVQKTARPLPAARPPIERKQRTSPQIEQILAEEGITLEEYNRQYNPDYKPLDKNPFGGMTEQEILDRNKQARTKRAVNPNAIPMPTAEQEEMLHTSRANAAAAHPQMQSIINLLTTAKKP